MATIVHRRVIRRAVPTPAEPVEAAFDEPRAPDARLDDALELLRARLTWVGWLSAVGAVAYLLVQLRFLLDDGVFSEARLTISVFTIVRAVGLAATIALPAALELGGAGARRAVPWLMRGAILIALSEVARLVARELRARAFEGLDPFDFTNPVSFAFAILGLAPTLVLIAGAWSMSDGLADAGARPSRRALWVVVAAALGLTIAVYVTASLVVVDFSSMLATVNNLSLLVSLVLIAFSTVLAVRLVAGAAELLPRRAWLVAGTAGASQLVAAFGLNIVFMASMATQGPLGAALIGNVLSAADNASWVLLAAAFAMGLGRRAGDQPEPARRLVARWVRYPAS